MRGKVYDADNIRQEGSIEGDAIAKTGRRKTRRAPATFPARCAGGAPAVFEAGEFPRSWPKAGVTGLLL